MNYNQYKDCYYSFENDILTIQNNAIRRKVALKDNYPVNLYVQNLKSGYKWCNDNKEKIEMFHIPGLDFNKCTMQVSSDIADHGGLSEKFLGVEVLFEHDMISVKLVFEIYSEQPFISTYLYVKGRSQVPHSNSVQALPNRNTATGIEVEQKDISQHEGITLPLEDTIDSIGICNKHLKLEAIQLYDGTDAQNTLIKGSEEILYSNAVQSFEGNMFILKDYLEDEGLVLVKEGLTAQAALNRQKDELQVKGTSFVQLTGTGLDYQNLCQDEYIPCYGATVGVATPKMCKRLYKQYYNKVYQGDKSQGLFIMSNTWGDRNQDKAVCESFMLEEIKAGKELGVDIIQIDDGWQKGVTANSALAANGVWEGYYAFDPNFWDVNLKKFSGGLKPVVQCAEDNKIKIGLWFSPDSSNDFANWEKDADVLLNLHRQYNIQYFKLDGIKIRNKICELNLIKMMDKVNAESNRQVSFNLDITAERRFGYYYQKQFGTIFVENRYTDWGNYYPHATLKNLWQLADVIPARKLLFEVLNIRRNTNVYMDDTFAPSNYGMDYVFACTMLSNPLMWMEMCNLEPQDRSVLADLIKVYKKERAQIFHSEVLPIGQLPDGISFTGFQVISNKTEGYFLLFRENNGEKDYCFKVSDLADKELNIEYLYRNGAITLDGRIVSDYYLNVCFDQPRAFVFAKYKVKE